MSLLLLLSLGKEREEEVREGARDRGPGVVRSQGIESEEAWS